MLWDTSDIDMVSLLCTVNADVSQINNYIHPNIDNYSLFLFLIKCTLKKRYGFLTGVISHMFFQ